MMRIARFCTPSISLGRYVGRPSWETGHACFVIGLIQVLKNCSNSRISRPDRLSYVTVIIKKWSPSLEEKKNLWKKNDFSAPRNSRSEVRRHQFFSTDFIPLLARWTSAKRRDCSLSILPETWLKSVCDLCSICNDHSKFLSLTFAPSWH